MRRWIRVEREAGKALATGSALRLVPITRTVTVGADGLPVALVWRRPVAVRLEGEDGVRELAVRDVTRWAQVALLAWAALWALLWLSRLGRGLKRR